jgi:hypothetical protein
MGVSVAGAILLLHALHGGPLALRIAAILAPLACGAMYIRYLVRDMQRLDELQLRIHLEAAATACVGLFVAAVVFPVVQMAGFAGHLEPYQVVFALIALVLVGYLNATRRYR